MGKLKQEIFAVGKWNGFPFTLNDLKKMKAAFESLKDVLKVPLKLGHNDEQPVLDGQPALGWVTDMEVDETQQPPKLVAVFDHVPDIMLQAFEKKLYRSVSIELDFDVKHKDMFYDFVVTAVALLGADMPAVNVLNDLGALMSRNSNTLQGDYVAGQCANFSAITGSQETSMDPELKKLQEQVEALEATNKSLQAKFTATSEELETKSKQFQAEKEAWEKQQRQADVDAARAKFTAILESAVKAETITPAQRELFSKVLRIDDDEAVLALKEEDVKSLFPEGAKFTRDDDARGGDNRQDTDEDPDDLLSAKAYEYMEKSGEKSFSRAVEIVMGSNPKLASDYIHSNGEIRHASR